MVNPLPNSQASLLHFAMIVVYVILTMTSAQTYAEVISVTCSNGISAPLPPSASLTAAKQMVFNVGGQSNVNCSWQIPPFNENSSTVFEFDSRFKGLFCNANKARLNVTEFNDYLMISPRLVAYACQTSDLQYMGGKNMSLMVTLEITTVSTSTITFGSYKSFLWPEGLCSENASEVVVSPGQGGPIRTFPSAITHLPNDLSCRWVFRPADGRGASTSIVFTVTLTVYHESSTKTNFSRVDDYITVYHLTKQPKSRWFGDNITIVETVIDGTLSLEYHSGPTGGAVVFSLSVQAKNTDYVCPETVQQLQATVGRVNVLKGVSLANENARDCRWEISTPSSDHVIMFLALFGNEPVVEGDVAPPAISCSSPSEDTLSIDGGLRSVGECNFTQIFPYWSQSRTTDILFHTTFPQGQRWFFLFYSAVARQKCQGKVSDVFNATESLKTIYEPTLPPEWRRDLHNLLQEPDGMDYWLDGKLTTPKTGSECQWQVVAKDDYWIKLTVYLRPCQLRHCNPRPVAVGLRVYDINGTSPSPIEPQPYTDRFIYSKTTSRVLVVFDKSLGVVPGVQDALNLTYQAFPMSYTSGAQQFLGGIVHLCFSLALSLFLFLGVWFCD